MMIFLLLYLHIQTIHAENRLVLSGGSNACEGRVDVYHDGSWGYVGRIGWNERNSAVVCKSLNCGDAKPNGHEFGPKTDRYRPKEEKILADDIKCEGNETNLWDCPFAGWNVVQSSPSSHVNVKCSKNATVTLEGGGRCDGFVKLNEKYLVCSSTWREDHAEQVCQLLNCGNATKSPAKPNLMGSTDTIRPFSCLQKDHSIWQCVDWTSTKKCNTPVRVTCTGHLYFRLKGKATVNLCSGDLEMFRSEDSTWQSVSTEGYLNISDTWNPNVICKQLGCGHSLTNKTSPNVSLSCSEKITISLKDNSKESKCYGLIYLIQQGQQALPVCFKQTNSDRIGAMVCQDLDCGEFMFSTTNSWLSPSWMSMSCPDHAESLWHCQKDQDNTRCQEETIICSGSIDVRLSDGLDNCSGRVEIYYKGAWRRISKEGWIRNHSHIVCSSIQCGKAHKESTKLFVDGNSNTRETLGLFLKSSCKANDPIHKCLQEKPAEDQNQFINVICQDHHVFFVNGSSSCSGTVWVEQMGQTYALSGQLNVWNDRAAEHVCQKMQCGHMANFRSTNRTTNVTKQLDCQLSKDDCKLQPATSLTTETAEVNCTGNVVVTLTNNNKDEKESKHRCSGHVQVCHGTNCRGVCQDVWKGKYSIMLCENLGCGKPITIPDFIRRSMTTGTKHDATISSVHCPKDVSNLSQCSFVVNNTVPCSKLQSTVHIVCSDSLKSKLSDPRDKCAGTPEVLLSGSWYDICGNEDVMNTVCAETGCGKAVNDTTKYAISKPKWQVTCESASESLAKCSFSVTGASCQSENNQVLRCSGWRRLLVVGQEGACKGPVFIKTASEHLYAISSAGWGYNESKVLCKNIGCGNRVNHSSISDISLTLWNKTYSCPERAENIWDCAEKDSPAQKEQLDINCSENPTINLNGSCYGEVIINGKDRVCSTGWTNFMSQILCVELHCGNPVNNVPVVPPLNGEAHHFSCTNKEVTPLQCASQKSNCPVAPAFVVCSGSLQFKLTDRCGGEIQVLDIGVWKPACLKKGKGESLLCNHFEGCGKVNNSKKSYVPQQQRTQRKDITLSISCEANSLHYCRTEGKCGEDDLTEIFCDGFIEKPPRELPVNLIVGVSVGLLLMVIAIALVFWQRRRIIYMLSGRRGFPQTTTSTIAGEELDLELQVKEERAVGLKNQANGQGRGLDSEAFSEYDDIDEEMDGLLNGTDEAPPLPARDVEVDDADDYTEAYDDVGELPLEEEEDKLGMPAQPEETSVPVALEQEDYVQTFESVALEQEDYVQPDSDE